MKERLNNLYGLEPTLIEKSSVGAGSDTYFVTCADGKWKTFSCSEVYWGQISFNTWPQNGHWSPISVFLSDCRVWLLWAVLRVYSSKPPYISPSGYIFYKITPMVRKGFCCSEVFGFIIMHFTATGKHFTAIKLFWRFGQTIIKWLSMAATKVYLLPLAI